MTEQTQPDGGQGASGQDPWAPPQGPSLHKQDQTPPSVHDQATMAAMPGIGSGPQAGPTVPPQHNGPAVPPPPIGPNGPGVPPYTPAPPVGYGYPSHPGPQGYPGPQNYPGPQGYPQPPAYGWGVPMGPAPQNNAGTAALVLGILSVVLFCLYGVASLILGIIAVILGVKGRRRADRGEATNRGQAQAGFVLGIIGIIVGIAMLALFIGIFVFAANKEDSRQGDDPFGSSYNSAPQLPGSPRI
ncbi:DUF4190 domain-containing protein [Streptomyces bauhiniae]|uniref:DUF4190 domain-containing protein n=1 Tax=Streptomyces bauhiniae TaxID=2340725 RepID=A0A7K3QWP0_9ACTN|nr:DUF4190 domain-containing protein [Streptomyces bauhiniae]